MARKRRILPQNTVFCVRLSRRRRSLQILSRLFLVNEVKKTVSLHVDTFELNSVIILLYQQEITSCSTVLNNSSQLSKVSTSNMSDRRVIGVPEEQRAFLAA